jgi:hypothetical protein
VDEAKVNLEILKTEAMGTYILYIYAILVIALLAIALIGIIRAVSQMGSWPRYSAKGKPYPDVATGRVYRIKEHNAAYDDHFGKGKGWIYCTNYLTRDEAYQWLSSNRSANGIKYTAEKTPYVRKQTLDK